ncbi:unnamed protein product, partial [Rotaria magnacalcarata]
MISSEVAQNDVAINELRANMTMAALKNNAISIAASLPPTQDSLFYHCLRTSRQVQIWIQVPDNYIKYPKLEHSGYQIRVVENTNASVQDVKLNETVNSNSQIVMKTTTNQTDFSTHHNSKFILSQYDDELSSEEEKSDQSS